MPTPDPSASLSAYQTWVVAGAGSLYELGQLLVYAVAAGLAMVVFAVALGAGVLVARR